MSANRSRLFALVLLPCCALALTGFGARESGAKETAPETEPGFYRDRMETPHLETPEPAGGEIVRVSGRVRLVGSALRSSLVVSGEEGDWYIEGGEQDLLMGLQHQNVTVEGRGYTEELILANGHHLGKRLILRDVRIIAQE